MTTFDQLLTQKNKKNLWKEDIKKVFFWWGADLETRTRMKTQKRVIFYIVYRDTVIFSRFKFLLVSAEKRMIFLFQQILFNLSNRRYIVVNK